MAEATFLKDLSSGDWVGGAYLYHLPKPVGINDTVDDDRTTHYIVVSWANTFDMGPETMAFPADGEGAVLSFMHVARCGGYKPSDLAEAIATGNFTTEYTVESFE